MAGGAEHTPRCEGRHVLAIQDSSDLDFTTTRERSRGLGEIGKGSGRAVFCGARCWVWVPGRAAFRAWLRAGYRGRIWTRGGTVIWPDDGSASEPTAVRDGIAAVAEHGRGRQDGSAPGHMVTEIRDRARDIYEKWARLPEPGFHILTRAMADRPIEAAGGKPPRCRCNWRARL